MVTRSENSPHSSLRVSSHARARALCFAAICLFVTPHSAHHSLPALTDAHADDSLMHVALNSGRLDTVNLLRVQHSTSYNLQGVVAPNSRRKVRRSCTVRNRSAEQTVDMSPATGAGTYRRSARQVLGNVWQDALVWVLVQVLVPVVGLVWLGVFRASLRPAWTFLARWWCHLGVIKLHHNLWVGRGYVVPRIREFGC